MTPESPAIYLIAAIVGMLVLIGLYQWFKTRRAQRRNEHSAIADAAHDLRGTLPRWHH